MSWLRKRAILPDKNVTSAHISDLLLEDFIAETVTYRSVDSMVVVDDSVHYPVDFLHTLNPPGIPQHLITLKVGTPVMLLINRVLPIPYWHQASNKSAP